MSGSISSKEFQHSIKQSITMPSTSFNARKSKKRSIEKVLQRWREESQKPDPSLSFEPDFILHDGPPYANGSIHIGTATNKVLKDFIVRSRVLSGNSVSYIPGWDCHGLPIEWALEKEWVRKGKKVNSDVVTEFRSDCLKYANEWVAKQREQFLSLGLFSSFKSVYKTSDKSFVLYTIKKIFNLLEQKKLYRDLRPVLWSFSERTSLAEWEVEYHQRCTTAVWFLFPLYKSNDTFILSWTTCPWTIPLNKGICYNEDIQYGIYTVLESEDACHVGQNWILAVKLKDFVEKNALVQLQFIRSIFSFDLICRHPFYVQGYTQKVQLIHGSFVSTKEGSGFVHIAPSHGEEDYCAYREALSSSFIDSCIDDTGAYKDNVLFFSRKNITDTSSSGANYSVINCLKDNKLCVKAESYTHRYPHSWRSHKPVYYMPRSQIFIDLYDEETICTALKYVKNIQWIPGNSVNRIKSMLNSRPNWLLSRQRFWGVPICLFVHKSTGEILFDKSVNEKVYKFISQNGCSAWFSSSADDFLPNKYKEEWNKLNDVVDVWFESGISHLYLKDFIFKGLIKKDIDCVLEGSDQHRGWFQSSLLTSSIFQDLPPFKTVYTHGFVLDSKNNKMSKSLGNVVDPIECVNQYGVEVFRLWIASVDCKSDVSFSYSKIEQTKKIYEKIRNTLRYLLGVLSEDKRHVSVLYDDLHSLEKYALYRLYNFYMKVQKYYCSYDFVLAYQEIFSFANSFLSSFYFDIRKDCLYCDAQSSLRKKGALCTFSKIFHYFCVALSPIIPCVVEEAWMMRYPQQSSLAYSAMSLPPSHWGQYNEVDQWDEVFMVRKIALKALEQSRQKNVIKSSLEACLYFSFSKESMYDLFSSFPMEDICIVSQCKIYPINKHNEHVYHEENDDHSIRVSCFPAQGVKCMRSWKVLDKREMDNEYSTLSKRDADAYREWLFNKNATGGIV